MQEHHIPFEFQGRFWTKGGTVANKGPEEVWFVLHGQGQLAKYFLAKFSAIANEQRRIISPEGMSRYYLDGFNGRVGATWMTKEDRLTDISNYIQFLTTIYKSEIPNPENCKITLLGFSQGAATASRWAVSDDVRFDRLILWAGLFPPDLDFEKGYDKLKGLEILNIYGTQDEYLNDERIAEQFKLANRLGVSLSTQTFQGGHEINENILQDLI
jgi:predicted esterase